MRTTVRLSGRSSGARRGERGAQRREERVEAEDAEVAVLVGEEPGQDGAVEEGVARARRGVGQVAQHPPRAVAGAHEVGRVDDQVPPRLAAGWSGRATGTSCEPSTASGGTTPSSRPAIAVEVGEDGVEQAGPLRDPLRQRLPVLGREDEGDRVEPPRARSRRRRRGTGSWRPAPRSGGRPAGGAARPPPHPGGPAWPRGCARPGGRRRPRRPPRRSGRPRSGSRTGPRPAADPSTTRRDQPGAATRR